MRIYVSKNQNRTGPFTLSELNEKVACGLFSVSDHACIDGQTWIPIAQIHGFIPPSVADEKPRDLTFTGKGSEFFGIWIVNLLLTICTFGIYSAWAKVRTTNYFYGNTFLDGASFSYVANPIAILKGRLIAFALFGLYTYFQTVEPLISVGIMLVVFSLIPLLVVRSMRFRMLNTEYRGLRFNFTGTVGQAYLIFFGGVILTYITMGILFPWWDCQKKQYLLGNLRYGQTRFQCFPRVGFFFKSGGICLLLGIGVFLLLFLGVMGAGFLVGESGAILFVLGFYVALGAISAYWHAQTTNHAIEATSLPGVSFRSRMTAGGLLSLWLVNIILLVITFGLATPWVMVRLARYRISCTAVFAQDLNSFIAGETERASALGEELGETIDLDIGI